MTPTPHPRLLEVTERIEQRSADSRSAYMAVLEAARKSGPSRAGMGCANAAHAYAAMPANDKLVLRQERAPHLGVITAYNDMLSAHQPYEHYPERIRRHARSLGATAQVAGGVPAMCDGITQGEDGMELSLFSRDVIALATAASAIASVSPKEATSIEPVSMNETVIEKNQAFPLVGPLTVQECLNADCTLVRS